MAINIVLDTRKHLRIAVTGMLDCETARTLLRRFNKSWPLRSPTAELDLSEVTDFHPGAIELLILLVEMTNGEVSPQGCNEELLAAYVSSLTGASQSPNNSAACRNFLTGSGVASCAWEGCPFAAELKDIAPPS